MGGAAASLPLLMLYSDWVRSGSLMRPFQPTCCRAYEMAGLESVGGEAHARVGTGCQPVLHVCSFHNHTSGQGVVACATSLA